MPAPLLTPFRELYRSAFVRNVFGLMAFTAIGQGTYLLIGPIIGRLYSPAEFGLYGFFFTVAATAALFLSLNYDFAIPAAANDRDAVDLTVGAMIAALIVSLLIGVAFGLASRFPIEGVGDLPWWSGALLALMLLAQAAFQIAQSWRVRRQETIVIGQASVTLNLVRGGVQVALGLVSPLWWALAGGELAGRIANVWHLLRGRKTRSRLPAARLSRVPGALRRYRDFPLILMPAQAIDSVAYFIQTAGVGLLLGAESLGQYFFMRRTLDVPVAFAFRSLSDLFYARFASDARTSPESVRPFFARSFLLLALGGAIAFVPVILWGPALFAFVFGPSWHTAGLLAAIMAPAMVMNLAVAPVSRVFALTSRPQLRYAFSITNLAGSIGVLAAAHFARLDLVGITAGFSICMFTSYAVYFASGYVACARLRSPEPDMAEQHGTQQ